jgi:hypothetical protein
MFSSSLLAYAMPIALVLAVGILVRSWRHPSTLIFVIVLSRALLDSVPALAYESTGAELPISRVYSASVLLLMGLYLLAKGVLREQKFGAFICLPIVAAGVSTLVNHTWSGLADVTTKWMYLWLLANLTMYAYREDGAGRTLWLLAFALIYPTLNQAYFGALQGPQIMSGQPSYIGSYLHESGLSYFILGLLTAAFGLCLTSSTRLSLFVALALLAWGHLWMYLNNYRTTLLSLLTIWASITIWAFPRFRLSTRVVSSIGAMLLGLIGAVALGDQLIARFGEIAVFVGNPGKYLNFHGGGGNPELFSGRIFIWNEYMSRFLNSSITTKIVGFGPESGLLYFGIHAHNQLIHTLYEGGLIGLSALLVNIAFALFWLTLNWRKLDGASIAMAGALLGVMTVAIGTSPLRDARAIIVLGISLGVVAGAIRSKNKVFSRLREARDSADKKLLEPSVTGRTRYDNLVR